MLRALTLASTNCRKDQQVRCNLRNSYFKHLSNLLYQTIRSMSEVSISDPWRSLVRVAASVLVESSLNGGNEENDSRKYLLIERGKEPAAGKWTLPGGSVNFGERIFDAGLRELEEEVCLSRDDVTLISHTTIATEAIHADEFHFVICTIAVSLPWEKRNSICAADDAVNAQWFSLKEIEKLMEEKKLAGNVPKLIEQFSALRLINQSE